MDRLEYAGDNDRFFDFCLWEYTPPAPPRGKFSAATLLFDSFEAAGIDDGAFDLVRSIREGIGHRQTVWGVKTDGSDLFWEFYFYDYRRKDREISITRLRDVLADRVSCRVEPNENLHYFMFSFDVDNELAAGRRPLDEIHLYIGNPGSAVSAGICYSLTPENTALENFYFFFDANKDREDIVAKTVCSAHVDFTRTSIDRILWPEMKGCAVVVVANKQANDAVYFSRVTIDQLLLFLKRLDYPDRIIAFAEANRAKLDHLLFDVGFDYRTEDGELVILKSAYYGIF